MSASSAKKIYFFSFFWMFLVVIPVIVPYFLSLGLSMSAVFQLQAIFGVSVVVLEIPTGYLCDLWGRKHSLVIGSFLSGVGFTFLIFVRSFEELVIYELIIALALSFVSGADISLLYDGVDKSDRKGGLRSLANMQMASVSGESAASLLGGALAIWSFRYVTIANAIAGWIPFFIALTVKEGPLDKLPHKSHWRNFTEVLKHLFAGGDRVLLLTFVNLVAWGLSTFVAVWLFQKYWQEGGVPLAYFGVIWAIYNISVGLVGKQVHSLEHRIGPIPLLIALSLLPVLGYFGLGLSSTTVGIVIGLVFYISRGITQVLLKDAMNWRIPNHYRATANSMQSFFFRLGFAAVGPVVGYGIDSYGMTTVLVSLGTTFLLLFVVATVPLIWELKKLHLTEIPQARTS